MFVLVIGWIVLRFIGGKGAHAESTDQGTTLVRSRCDPHVDAMGAKHQEEPSDTFDSFTPIGDVETAVVNKTVRWLYLLRGPNLRDRFPH